jgi:hypothetical protein
MLTVGKGKGGKASFSLNERKEGFIFPTSNSNQYLSKSPGGPAV